MTSIEPKNNKYAKRVQKQKQRPKLTPLESRFEPLCVFLERATNYLHLALSGMGAVLLAIYPLLTSWWHTVGLWGGILSAFSGLILAIIRSTVLTDLEQNIIALEDREETVKKQNEASEEKLKKIIQADKDATYLVLNDAADGLYDDLKLRDPSTRLSLYFHEEISQSFTRIARVSDNPSLVSTGRHSYSDKQGFIAQVWNNKSAYVPKMPKARNVWVRHQMEQYDFTLEEATNLTMHTRCIIGVRLDYRSRPVGVLIIESEVPESLESAIDVLNDSPVCTDTLPRLFVASEIALGKNLQLAQ